MMFASWFPTAYLMAWIQHRDFPHRTFLLDGRWSILRLMGTSRSMGRPHTLCFTLGRHTSLHLLRVAHKTFQLRLGIHILVWRVSDAQWPGAVVVGIFGRPRYVRL